MQRTIDYRQIIETVNPIEIDHMRWPDQAKIHQRHQTLAARQWPGLIAEACHEIECFGDGCRIVIFEICRFH